MPALEQFIAPSICSVQIPLENVKYFSEENPLAPSAQARTPHVVPPSYLVQKECNKSGISKTEQETSHHETIFYNQCVEISGNVIEIRQYEETITRGQGRVEMDESEDEPKEKVKRVRTPEEVAHDNYLNDLRGKHKLIKAINSNWGWLPRGFRPGMKTVKKLTLTWEKCIIDLDEVRSELEKFIDRLEYKLNEKVEYVCVWEFQKRGALHLHLMMYCSYIEGPRKGHAHGKTWLEKNWSVKTGQGHFKINKIDWCQDLGHYEAKYLTKDLTEDHPELVGRHKFWCSEGFTAKTRKHYVVHKDLSIFGRGKQGMNFQDYIDFFEGFIACNEKSGRVLMWQGSFWGAWTGKVDCLKITLKPCPEAACLVQALEESLYWLSS